MTFKRQYKWLTSNDSKDFHHLEREGKREKEREKERQRQTDRHI